MIGGSCIVYEKLAKFGDSQIAVLCAHEDYRTDQELAGWREQDAQASYPVKRLRLLRPPLRPKWPKWLRIPLIDIPRMILVACVVILMCRKHNCQTICIGEIDAGGWLTVLANVLGYKAIIYTHGDEISTPGDDPMRVKVKRQRAIERAHSVVAVSRFNKDALVSLLDVAPEKVFLLINGVDTEHFNKSVDGLKRRQELCLEDHLVIVTVTRLVPRKGVDYTLKAVARLREKFPNLHYVIAGDGPQKQELEKLANDLNINDCVTFLGNVPHTQIPEIYAAGDVFCMPNRRMEDGENEGFGLVYLEANAVGVPAISGKEGGVVDAVHHEVNGLQVDGSSVDDIEGAIDRILSGSDLRGRLSKNGLKVADAASWKSKGAEFLDYCHALPSKLQNQTFHDRCRPIADTLERPVLTVNVDAEEEFDWRQIRRDQVSVENILSQQYAQNIFEKNGVRPTYLVDFPVLENERAVAYLKQLQQSGLCDLGCQMHPWVTPPFEEEVNDFNSFLSNLSGDLQRAKVHELKHRFEKEFGISPKVFRAGRYGISRETASIISNAGFQIDTSIMPHTSFVPLSGPDFRDFDEKPLAIGGHLISLPYTVGYSGFMARYIAPSFNLLDSPLVRKMRIPAVLSRINGLNRIRISPEGATIEEAKEITRLLYSRGTRTFSLNYHSSSLLIGGSPYVRSEEDRSEFLSWLEQYIAFFSNELGGEFLTAEELAARLWRQEL